ncbi:hydroxysqualene dehydroxylase HpnE [Parvibium lacunae]|uniref:FAD-dependent oxidoreductase n=1 Tax=Parvibium lacunae TaxID=1888893 RepID=A0A368L9A3_9BURK|nr:hydroxysqualene dehydroxylase HpnE [Parvibium lacunae]RCS59819.1 FAD-dependent oxidoreductase [Parvibium lacunae]
MQESIAIVGAGWAGCTAAYRLAQAGYRVTLYDAAAQPGGRARTWHWENQEAFMLDNGQHLLIGAYHATLSLLAELGTLTQLQRSPFRFCYVDGYGFKPPAWVEGSPIKAYLPPSLQLLIAWLNGTQSSTEKWALVRFFCYALGCRWQAPDGQSVIQLMRQYRQPANLVDRLWRPLCVAALNTPIELASARVFLAVLHDTFFGPAGLANDLPPATRMIKREKCHPTDYLLPKCSLGELLPEPICAWLTQQQHDVFLGELVTAVRPLSGNAPGVSVQTRQHIFQHRACVIATRWQQLTQILPPAILTAQQHQTSAQPAQPITTVYLRYPSHYRLPAPIQALRENTDNPGQWVIDKGQLDPKLAGLFAVVISTQTEIKLTQTNLVGAVCLQLQREFSHLQLPSQALDYQLIQEKRATFQCDTARVTPSPNTLHPAIWLCGDYLLARYPATLESAVRSGNAVAKAIIERFTG